jgi:hypothetical protein
VSYNTTYTLYESVQDSSQVVESVKRSQAVTELKTPQSLLDALRKAAEQSQSEDDVKQQRVSFIMGSLSESSDVTHARVREVLARQEGKKAG